MNLLDRALEAHGGLDRWRQVESVSARVSCGGAAFRLRFQGGRLSDFTGTCRTRQPHTVVDPYPAPGTRGVFDGGHVRIERPDGSVVAERRDARRAFRWSARRQIWWDDLDLLYFAGYALWNYLSAPFVFAEPGFATRELGAGRLEVAFPAHVPTHCRRQVFHFGDDGLLRRLDYTAEPFGRWARAAHLCHEHREVEGLVFPTRRRVYPRAGGRSVGFPTLVRVDLSSLRLT